MSNDLDMYPVASRRSLERFLSLQQSSLSLEPLLADGASSARATAILSREVASTLGCGTLGTCIQTHAYIYTILSFSEHGAESDVALLRLGMSLHQSEAWPDTSGRYGSGGPGYHRLGTRPTNNTASNIVRYASRHHTGFWKTRMPAPGGKQ